MKKRLITIMLVCVSILSVSSCFNNNKPITTTLETYAKDENLEFNNYLDEIFIDMLKDSPLDINFLLKNPQKYNLDQEKAVPTDYSQKSYNEYMDYIQTVINDLNGFLNKNLTQQQALDKEIVIDAFSRDLKLKPYHYYQRNLGSYLGYQAQLPLILAEYRFDDLVDINNYFDIIHQTKQTFENIIVFETEKIPLNLVMNNYMIEGIEEQITNFLNSPYSSLETSFNNKVASLNLDEKTKNDLILQNHQVIEDDLVPAYTYLKTEVAKFKDKATNLMGLSKFDQGKGYYESLFQNEVGVDVKINDIISEVDRKINSLISSLRSIIILNSNIYETLDKTDFTLKMSKEQFVPYFFNNIENDFPPLAIKNVAYTIKDIDESLQENSSPAMYFLSPIDEIVEEVIYINPLQFSDDPNYAFFTLAHESVPGHLYQHLYFKERNHHVIRDILNFGGYVEGWATYAENYVIKYPSKNSTINNFNLLNNYLNYMLELRLDLGINYQSWTKAQFKSFLKDYYGELKDETITEYYYHIIEVPTNSAKYYYGFHQFMELQSYLKTNLKDQYSDYIFHKIILDTGPSSFTVLKKQFDRYILENKVNTFK